MDNLAYMVMFCRLTGDKDCFGEDELEVYAQQDTITEQSAQQIAKAMRPLVPSEYQPMILAYAMTQH